MSMERGSGKKGQVTMFILVAIVIVSAILVFFLWARPTYFSQEGKKLGFESCIEDAVEQVMEDLEAKAGLIDPEFTYAYKGEDLTYLCYTSEYYKTCTVQRPFLKQTFDDQLEISIRDSMDTCYSNSINELKSQGYDVVSGEINYDVVIEPGVIRVEVNAPTTVGSQRFTKFNVRINSALYETLMIATSILQFEVKYGDSDVTSMMGFYPDYVIDKIKRGDGTTVYMLENKVYGNKFKFASRSLAWPPGYA